MFRSALFVCGLVLACLSCVCARAEPAPAVQATVRDLAREFPAGSIDTPERITRALDLAGRVGDRIARESEAGRKRCEHVFFVNSCMNSVRRRQRTGEEEVQRVTLEAHDYRRLLDARSREQGRADALRRQALDDLDRPRREAEAMQAAQARQSGAQAREEDAARIAQQAELVPVRSVAEREQERSERQAIDEEARPGREAGAERAFEQKSTQASDYARTRIRDREANEKRRAEREAARRKENPEAAK